MNKPDVAEYLEATAGVEGWFFPIDAYIFGMIDEIQKRERIAGNLFEIGVHHGKTAILLGRMAGAGETLGVCDVFEDQSLNVDKSGEGSRELFVANMNKFTRLAHLAVFAKRSAALTEDETTTHCRFFHIDGGHRAEDVFADLITADRALSPDGVAALDDLFNPSWPGVSEGFYNFVATRPDTFVPLFIGGNKVYFTRADAAARYEQHWSEPASIRDFFEPGPFTFEMKDWLGRRVMAANRTTWADLDPIAAARAHLGANSWKVNLLTMGTRARKIFTRTRS